MSFYLNLYRWHCLKKLQLYVTALIPFVIKKENRNDYKAKSVLSFLLLKLMDK